jgi:hypothetical protein
MDPNLVPQRFGGGGATNIHPLVAVILVLVGVLVLFLPRKYTIVPLLAASFLVPLEQTVVVGSVHFQFLRILIFLGWARLLPSVALSGTKLVSEGLNAIDKSVILCSLFGAIGFVLLWRESAAVVNQLGQMYTTLGVYFMLRFYIRDQEDVERAIRTFAIVAVAIAVVMVREQITAHNVFAFLGGIRTTVMQRGTGIRAMGPFEHPITAGVMGAVTFPLFLSLLLKGDKSRLTLLLGGVAAFAITLAAMSSTGLIAAVAALCSFCLWPLRNQMSLIRKGIVACLITLHMIMKAPVWALIGHMGVVGGSDSWHREYVVDQFIRRFFDWWLIGTRDNYNWGWDMWDITNEYVATGFSSGVIPFIFFVAIIVYAFKYVGRARKAVEGNKRQELFFWALGAALFANVAAFFGVIYFDQIQVAWYATLAIISVTTIQATRSEAPQATQQEYPGSRGCQS